MESQFSVCQVSMELRQVQSKLAIIAYKIENTSIRDELIQLIPVGNECVEGFISSFNKDGNTVLVTFEKLSRITCPSRVDIDCLFQVLESFRSSIQKANDKAVALRSKINDAVMSTIEEKKRNENEISLRKLEINGLTMQIKVAEDAFKKFEKEAITMEIAARELEEWACSLQNQSRQHRENGFLWFLATATVGIIFTPFTGGASLFAGLAAAGIGATINFNSALQCKNTASALWDTSKDRRINAARQRDKMSELYTEKQQKLHEISKRERKISMTSNAHQTLVELGEYLLRSIKCIKVATEVVLNVERALNVTKLQGDTFEILQEVFVEDPEEFYEETHDEMKILKEKWKELKRMILPYSDRSEITF